MLLFICQDMKIIEIVKQFLSVDSFLLTVV